MQNRMGVMQWPNDACIGQTGDRNDKRNKKKNIKGKKEGKKEREMN